MVSVLHVDVEPSEPTIFAIRTFDEAKKINMKLYCTYPEGNHFVCHCGRTFKTEKNYKAHFCWSEEDTMTSEEESSSEEDEDSEGEGNM